MDLVDWDAGAFERVSAEMDEAGPAPRHLLVHGHPYLGPARRQRRAPLGRRPLVRGADRARGPRVGAGRRLGFGPRHPPGHRAAPADPVDPAPAGRRPHLRRHRGRRAAAPWRRGGRAPPRATAPPSSASTPMTVRSTRPTVGLSISVHLTDDLDVSRGDLLAAADEPAEVTTELEATVCWFGERPLQAGNRLRVKHTTRVTPARVDRGQLPRLDVNELHLVPVDQLVDNEIGVVRLAHRHPARRRPLPPEPHHRELRAGRRGRRTSRWRPAWSGPPSWPTSPSMRRPAERRVHRPVPMYPVVLRIEGRRCLVVGGGPVAARKVAELVRVRRPGHRRGARGGTRRSTR